MEQRTSEIGSPVLVVVITYVSIVVGELVPKRIGLIPIVEIKDRLAIKAVSEEEKGRYHTRSGMVMWLLGRMPNTGHIATWENWRFEVIDLDGKRIDKVLAIPLPEPAAEAVADTEPPAPAQD